MEPQRGCLAAVIVSESKLMTQMLADSLVPQTVQTQFIFLCQKGNTFSPPQKKVGHLMKALVWRNWWWSCYKIDEVRSFHWMFYFKLLSDKFMFLTQISFTIIRCLIWVWDINWKLGINTYEMNREAAILGSRRNWTV